jgi:endonuclease/exonuclease/phosphatase family metal-dependent hydrolase
MLFSKIPLFDKRAMTFKAETIEEEIFAYKGVLAAKIKIKGLGEIIFYNLHTTAGGIRDQQDPSVERIRESEIRQVAGSVGKSRGRGIKIILGDINAGPQVSKKNYDVFRELGFLDAYHQKHPSESPARITWDPKNKLNIHGPHCRCPRQRIDHIFIKDADLKRLRIDKADIVLKNPTVRLRFGKRVTVSDHYGLSITIGSRSAIP